VLKRDISQGMDSSNANRNKIVPEHFDGALVPVREQTCLCDFGLLLRCVGLPLRDDAAPNRQAYC